MINASNTEDGPMFSDAILAKAQSGATFTDDEVTPDLSREASTFIRGYAGTFAFLRDVQEDVCSRAAWRSRAQVRGVLNCMVAEVRRSTPPARVSNPAADAEMVAVRDGTYTLVASDGSHRTIRVEAGQFTDGTPVQWVSFLSGSDNTSDYTCCGYIVRESFRFTRRFADTTGPLADAVYGLLAVTEDQRLAYGIAYARESGNCWICHRTLTTPESLHAGYGPTCAEHYGLPWGDVPEGVVATPATVEAATSQALLEAVDASLGTRFATNEQPVKTRGRRRPHTTRVASTPRPQQDTYEAFVASLA